MSTPISLTIQRLYANNRDALKLTWFAGLDGGNRQVSSGSGLAADQVGHLNLIHPMRIQVFGASGNQLLRKALAGIPRLSGP